mmetsp:Transcript_11760/g.28527  ORF Transcript_11760/g.28527 Transcript_11760/m.28527 type:complete len:272 (+) Transcript_11760:175-990(+)
MMSHDDDFFVHSRHYTVFVSTERRSRGVFVFVPRTSRVEVHPIVPLSLFVLFRLLFLSLRPIPRVGALSVYSAVRSGVLRDHFRLLLHLLVGYLRHFTVSILCQRHGWHRDVRLEHRVLKPFLHLGRVAEIDLPRLLLLLLVRPEVVQRLPLPLGEHLEHGQFSFGRLYFLDAAQHSLPQQIQDAFPHKLLVDPRPVAPGFFLANLLFISAFVPLHFRHFSEEVLHFLLQLLVALEPRDLHGSLCRHRCVTATRRTAAPATVAVRLGALSC